MRLKKILIADPRPLSREGLKSVLGVRDYSIVFSDAGNDQEFVNASRHCKAFDLILVHADFLLLGKNGLIASYLYKNDNPTMVICDAVSEELDIKLKFFNISGVIKNSDAIETIERNVFGVLAGQDRSGYFSQQVYQTLKEVRTEESTYHDIPDSGHSFSKAKLAYLTDRQNVVLNYLKVGLMNKEIAFELGIQESTVKRHVSDIFKKLHVKNRTQLTACLSG